MRGRYPRTLARAARVRISRNEVFERRNLRYVTGIRGYLNTEGGNLISKVDTTIALRFILTFLNTIRRCRDR